MRVTQALQRNLQQQPDEIATIDGDRQRSWAELCERVARLAGGLSALGLVPGDRVGIIALNSDRYFELMLAVPWAGGVIVPVNYRWSAPEIAYALNDSQTRMLFVDREFWSLVPDLRALVEHDLKVICVEAALDGCDATHDGLVDTADGLDEYPNTADSISGIF